METTQNLLEEQERRAYISGDVNTARLLALAVDEISSLRGEIRIIKDSHDYEENFGG